MKKIDCVIEILKCCHKREEILINNESVRKYNYYFDKIRKYERILIAENRQDELLPFLECDSISICSDIANILFQWYSIQCIQVL